MCLDRNVHACMYMFYKTEIIQHISSYKLHFYLIKISWTHPQSLVVFYYIFLVILRIALHGCVMI